MNCHEFQEQLADYVAGELPASDRAAADAHVAACAVCRREAGELIQAQDVIRAGLTSAAVAENTVSRMEVPPIAGERSIIARLGWAGARYAALVALGFLGGYAARDRGAETRPPLIESAPTVHVPETTALNPAIVARYQAAETTYPDASKFSRSLLALARP